MGKPNPSFTFWNANRLTTEKLHHVEFLAARTQTLVFAVCETRHDPEDDALPLSASVYTPPDYVPYRKPIASNSGGIVVFVRDSLIARRRTDLEKSPHCIALECTLDSLEKPLLILTCYRQASEGKPGWAALSASIRAAAEPGYPLLLLGDFNARSQSFGDPVNEFFGLQMSALCDELNLLLLNTRFCSGQPTRNASVLDLAICNEQSLHLFAGMSIGGKNGLLSDHESITLTLADRQSTEPAPRQEPRRDLRNADWQEFSRLLDLHAPDVLARCKRLSKDAQNPSKAVDCMVDSLNSLFESAAADSIPMKVPSKKVKHWWKKVPGLQAKLKCYQKAKRRHYRSKRASDALFAADKREIWLRALDAARLQRRERQLDRVFQATQLNWQALKEQHTPANYPLSAVRDEHGNLATTKKEALNSQAKFFANVCSLPELKHESDEKITSSICHAALSSHARLDKPFTVEEVKSECYLIKNAKSAPGPDKIPTLFLKRSPDEVFEILTVIFNYSWSEGVLPKQWRQANVCPLFKPGAIDRTDRSNYRPISLTSTVCKLMERVVLRRLRNTIGDKIHWRQFGFKPNHDCLDGLVRLQRNVFNALKKRSSHLSVAFLDISKAFDRTWHGALLHKLSQMGIKGHAWRWCRAFLSDRQLRTTHKGDCSKWFSFTAGVPQGSVLSPFLFLVFINDIFEFKHNGKRMEQLCELSLYADDIAVVPLDRNSDGDRQLSQALQLLEAWAKLWRVDFSPTKSKVLRFTNRSRSKVPRSFHPFLLNGVALESVKSFKYLGLHWQTNCRWHIHTEKVMASARRASNFVSSLVSPVTPRLKYIRHLAHALVRTKFAYGLPIWASSSNHRWHQMDVLVVEPMRRALRLPKNSFVQSLLVETNTLSLKLQHEMLAVSLLLKAQRLKSEHSTRRILEEQAAEQQDVKSRTPIFVFASIVILRREVDLADNRRLSFHFLRVQRREWQQSGKGKLLVKLSGPEPKKRFSLPLYFESDSPRVASIRAKLRFNRTNIKHNLQRQNILKAGDPITCDHCGHDETLWHVLFACSRYAVPRKTLLTATRKKSLPNDTRQKEHWILGDVSSISQKLQSLALELSAAFISAINEIRPL